MKKATDLPKCPTCGMPKEAHLACDFCYGRTCQRCLEPLFLDESIRLTAYEEIHQRCKSQPRPRPAYMPLQPPPPKEQELIRLIVGVNDERLLGRKLKPSPQTRRGRRVLKPTRSKTGQSSPVSALLPA